MSLRAHTLFTLHFHCFAPRYIASVLWYSTDFRLTHGPVVLAGLFACPRGFGLFVGDLHVDLTVKITPWSHTSCSSDAYCCTANCSMKVRCSLVWGHLVPEFAHYRLSCWLASLQKLGSVGWDSHRLLSGTYQCHCSPLLVYFCNWVIN